MPRVSVRNVVPKLLLQSVDCDTMQLSTRPTSIPSESEAQGYFDT